jgi:hypothetical protein
MQCILLTLFGMALFSVSLFAVTLDNKLPSSINGNENASLSLGKSNQHQRGNVNNVVSDRVSSSLSMKGNKETDSNSKNNESNTNNVNVNSNEVVHNKDTNENKIPINTDTHTHIDPNQNIMDIKDIQDIQDIHYTSINYNNNIIKYNSEYNNLYSLNKKKGDVDIHFIHIPKCGGTSMTSILRQIICNIGLIGNDGNNNGNNNRNKDCCTNPGFCDWHAMRRCSSIKGCINHIPMTPWIYNKNSNNNNNKDKDKDIPPVPSIALVREPISRILSAWFYNCHSPNSDCYQVRPEFKLIKKGLRPKATFDDYLYMPEYHNIQTRMLGANSFPYKDVSLSFCAHAL